MGEKSLRAHGNLSAHGINRIQGRLRAHTAPSPHSALGRQGWNGPSCQGGLRREMEQSPPDMEHPCWLDFATAAFRRIQKTSKFSHCCLRFLSFFHPS